jgi:predicted transcriptional regulator of viral defense system
MALTWKQKKVIQYAISHGGLITKAEAMGLINTHYRNGAKHVGDCLARMVKQGYLTRVKNGVYKVGGVKPQDAVDPNQTHIF